jgi:RNA polymerase sigma-70 factor (ECF subfamily)
MATTMEQIYKENYNDILNYIYYKVQNKTIAEDIASDVFYKVLNTSLSTFNEEKCKISTWLHRVAISCIQDYHRGETGYHNKLSVAVSDFVNDEGKEVFQFLAPEEANHLVETNEFSSRVADAFRGLKPKYRKVAILFFLRDKEYSDIAEICQIPMGSVKGMISRIRERLQTELKGEMAHLVA